MTSLVSRLRGPRIASLEAFARLWIPIVLSALPFWSSGQNAYRVVAVGAVGALGAVVAGVPILAPASAALAIRLSFDRRMLGIWFCAVFPSYVVVLWCLSGFNAGNPCAWYTLWQTWFANDPISLWIPVCTGVALLLWLGPTHAGGRRIDLSFPRLRYPHFLSFVLVCVVTPGLIGWYFQPLSIASRVGFVLGVVAAMSLVSRLYQSATQRLRTDTKRLAVNEAQRDEPSAQQPTRIAAVVQAAHADPVDPFAFANEETVMPTLEVGIRESAADAEVMPEMIPQKGDLLGPGETLSARSWQVLDAGNEDDEDDNYALMRASYQRVAADVEALNLADSARVVVIPIEVEPAPPPLPDAEDLPPGALATMLPHADLDDDLSDSEILAVADPIELGPPVPDREPARSAPPDEADPAPADVTVAPEALPTTVGAFEPMVMEVLAEDPPATEEARLPPVVPMVAPPDLPVAPAVDRLPFGPEPEEGDDDLNRSPVLATPVLAPGPSAQPDFSIDLDITKAEIQPPSQGHEIASVIAAAPGVMSDADPAATRRLRSMVSRMISAHIRIVSEGGGPAEIQRLIAPNLTPAHEAMLDQFGGRDLRLALEALRADTGETPASPQGPIADLPAASTQSAPEPDAIRDHGPSVSDRVASDPVVSAEPVWDHAPAPLSPPAEEHPDLGPTLIEADPQVGDVAGGSVQAPSEDVSAAASGALAPTFEVDLPAILGATRDADQDAPPRVDSLEAAPVSAQPMPDGSSASASEVVITASNAARRLREDAPSEASRGSDPSALTPSLEAVSVPTVREGVEARSSEDVMYPVFELDDALIAKASAPEAVPEIQPDPHPEPEPEVISAEDARAMALISEWLAIPPLSEMDLEQHLLKRGRGLPDDMEIEFLTRKLSEYDATPKSFHGLEGMLSSLMIRPGGDGSYDRQDVAMAKGIFSLISSHIYDRWKFTGREHMLTRLVFFFNDPYTKRLASRIDGWLKDGFTAQKDVALARAQLAVIESFYLAYPDRAAQLRDLNAALDLAEFSFSQPTVGQTELVHEGLHSGFARDVSAATGRARARLQTAALPMAVQDAIAHFMKVASVIDEIDVMIKRESIKHKAPTEAHPLYSALMELEYRAVETINDLRSKLVRRENVLDELPALLRERNKDAAHLFERLQADADAISEAVVDSRERLAAAEHGLVEIERLGSIIAQRDETVADLRKDLSQRVVMDALVAAANILAEREPRLAVIERKGLAKLRAVVEPGVEVAVVFVHGLDSKWSVMSGSRLEMQGVRGETVQSLDLKAMRETVRNTHAFASATSVRLRVVLESGDLAGGRTDFVFTRQEVVANPSKLLDESDFDSL